MSPPEDLVAAASKARSNAHAPYSRYAVGAALRTATGTIHAGCNVENASFPEGWCAETSAIAAMVTTGERKIVEVCIVGPEGAAITPCGGCRQRLAEFCGPDTPVHMSNGGHTWRTLTLEELLPASFTLGPGAGQ